MARKFLQEMRTCKLNFKYQQTDELTNCCKFMVGFVFSICLSSFRCSMISNNAPFWQNMHVKLKNVFHSGLKIVAEFFDSKKGKIEIE